MIVVSGALVLVALILLIIGLLGEGLGMIWASIGTSVVAGVFLLLGALQRRGAAPAAAPGATGSPDMLERVTAVSVRPREEAAEAAPAASDDAYAEPAAAAAGGGEVSVVPGRPRYHVASCRFLAGRPDVETTDVDQARSDGFTACGVCKPDLALANAAAATEPEAMPEPITADTTVDDISDTLAAPAPAKKAPAKRTRTAAAAGTATTMAAAPVEEAVAAPAKPARKAAAPAAPVVVVPDRGKFHVETCRFVRDVPGTVTLSKPAAKRQGYVPCGVCKP